MRTKRPKFQKERPPDQRGVDVNLRLFIAVPLPQLAQEHMSNLTGILAKHDWPVRWVGAGSAHLTLHFLGEVTPERAELMRMSLGAAVNGQEPFTLGTTRCGVFPDFRAPRVLWCGLDGQTDRLGELHQAVGKHLHAVGFEVDREVLVPHVTLGRVRDNPPPDLGAKVRRAYDDPALAAEVEKGCEAFTVSEIQLVRSLIGRGGPIYEVVGRYELRTR